MHAVEPFLKDSPNYESLWIKDKEFQPQLHGPPQYNVTSQKRKPPHNQQKVPIYREAKPIVVGNEFIMLDITSVLFI